MSITRCKYCEKTIDEDYNVEHEDECRLDNLRQEFLDRLESDGIQSQVLVDDLVGIVEKYEIV